MAYFKWACPVATSDYLWGGELIFLELHLQIIERYIFKWTNIYKDSQFMNNYTKKKENVQHIHFSALNSFTPFP